MSSPSVPEASAGRSSAWLFGPRVDLFVGCGGLYILLCVVLAAELVPNDRLQQERLIVPVLILLASVPHYGATLLRVFGTRDGRHRFGRLGLLVTIAVYGSFFGALNHVGLATWLLTIYVTWSPWHYTGQNYGIATMLLRRSGVALEERDRRFLHVSFICSYAIVFLGIHGHYSRVADFAASTQDRDAVSLQPLGIPDGVNDVLVPIAAIGVLVGLASAGTSLVRRAGWRPLGPAAAVVLLQSFWFTIPFGLAQFDVTTGISFIDLAARDFLFPFIAVSHACQYLWVTAFHARASGRDWNGLGRYWITAIAVGHVVTIVPTFLAIKAPAIGVGYDAAIPILVLTCLNLHHFILDGAIWKTRSGWISRILIRSESPPPLPEEPRALWKRVAVVSLIALSVGNGVIEGLVRHFGVQGPLDRGVPTSASRALDALDRVGRDSAPLRHRVAVLYASQGKLERAKHEAERSLAVKPSAQGWHLLGSILAAGDSAEGAFAAFDRALEMKPNSTAIARDAGMLAARIGADEEVVRRLRPLAAAQRLDDVALDAYVSARRRLKAGSDAEAEPR